MLVLKIHQRRLLAALLVIFLLLRIRLQIRFDLYFLWIGHLLPWELKGDKGRILLVEGAGQDLGNVLLVALLRLAQLLLLQ